MNKQDIMKLLGTRYDELRERALRAQETLNDANNAHSERLRKYHLSASEHVAFMDKVVTLEKNKEYANGAMQALFALLDEVNRAN